MVFSSRGEREKEKTRSIVEKDLTVLSNRRKIKTFYKSFMGLWKNKQKRYCEVVRSPRKRCLEQLGNIGFNWFFI